MAVARLVLCIAGAAWAGGAVAQDRDDEELPDLEFLEYLGSWENGDEDWVVVAEQFMGQPVANAADAPAAVDAEAAEAAEAAESAEPPADTGAEQDDADQNDEE